MRNDLRGQNHWLKLNSKDDIPRIAAPSGRVWLMHYGGKVQAQSVIEPVQLLFRERPSAPFWPWRKNQVADIDVYWPNGAQEHFKAVAADQLVTDC